MIAALPQYALYVVVMLTMLSLLVAAHELGHYLFARLFGMGAEEFAVGMGKPVLVTYLRRRYTVPVPEDHPGEPGDVVRLETVASALEGGGETREATIVRDARGRKALRETTEFTLRPWPLGGFVRIKGMLPHEDGSETRVPGGFYSKPPWQRFVVLLAGPAFSVLAGVALLIGLYSVHGIERLGTTPTLGAVIRDMAAWNAGLRPDDRIVTVDGRPVARFYDFLSVVRDNPGRELEIVYERDGRRATTRVTPVRDREPTPVMDEDFAPLPERRIQGKIGVLPQPDLVRLTFAEATREALRTPAQGVRRLFAMFSSAQVFRESVGGPGTIAVATASAVDGGIAQIVRLAGMLSISVGLFNLLPVFPLDGGQMTVAAAEMIRGGRRLSMRLQNLVGTVGFALVALLVVCILAVDVDRFWPKRSSTPPLKMEIGRALREER